MGASRESVPTPPGEELRLIDRARSGDADAQQSLWHAHRRWVAAIVLAHRPRQLEVDDLMQDVAVKFVSKLETLRDPEAFRPWLRQIAINICRGAARGLKPTLQLASGERDDSGPVEPGRAAMPADREDVLTRSIDRRDAAHRLLEQAVTLPNDYREPLLLRCTRGLTYEQISRILDLPVTTIETRLARARRMLREEIGEEVAAEGWM